TCDTHPHTTSSMTFGSMPARCTSSLSTTADRSAACMADRPPLRLPTGVRTASTMTVSRIFLLRSLDRPLTRERRLTLVGERGISLCRVLGAEVTGLRSGFVSQRIAHGPVGALVQQCLAVRQRNRRSGGQSFGDVGDERVDLAGVHHPCHQAECVCFSGADALG